MTSIVFRRLWQSITIVNRTRLQLLFSYRLIFCLTGTPYVQKLIFTSQQLIYIRLYKKCKDAVWISSSHPPEKKATFELSSIWSLSNVWPCPENSTGQPPGACLLFLQRLTKGYLMSFDPVSDLSEKMVFGNPCSKIGCWESVKMLNETSCKVCMPFQWKIKQARLVTPRHRIPRYCLMLPSALRVSWPERQ